MLWPARNEVVFQNDKVDQVQILELIQLHLWNWDRVKLGGFYDSRFEWKSNPVLCLHSL